MTEPISRRTFAASCAVAAGAIATPSFADEPAPKKQQPQLRVVTYNIHHGRGTDGVFDYQRQAKLITDLQPDIVAVQEVDKGVGRSSGVDQATKLGELCGMHSVFGRAMHFDGGEYGEAILSRYPLHDAKAHVLPFRYRQEPRAALAARIKPTNGLPEIHFVATHLCHQSSETRVEQAQHLNGMLPATGPTPVLLAGDLNARPGSAPMQTLLTERWTDAIAPNSRIDYILYRQADPWRVVQTTIVDDRLASDHKPVLAVLEWQGEA